MQQVTLYSKLLYKQVMFEIDCRCQYCWNSLRYFNFLVFQKRSIDLKISKNRIQKICIRIQMKFQMIIIEYCLI